MKRLLCLIMGIGLWSGAFCAADCRQVLTDSLRALLADRRAEVGVAAVLDDGSAFTYGNDRRYPMLSVFKFHLALAVLHRLDSLRQPLTLPLDVSAADLRPDTWSPLRERYPGGGVRLSVAELLRYSVAQSDNNACDRLLRYVGGPRAVDAYVRRLGIESFAIRRTEDDMHRRPACCVDNWTTPLAAARLLERFCRDTLFVDPAYADFLCEVMCATVTGADKLRAGLPAGVRLGHKTGSSDRDTRGMKLADNDIGFVRLPDGRWLFLAVFVTRSYESDATNAALIADVARLVMKAIDN